MSARLINWLLSRPARERVLLAILVAVVLPIAVVAGVILPLRDAHAAVQQRLEDVQGLQRWVVERVIEKNEFPQSVAVTQNPESIGSSGIEESLIAASLRDYVSTLSLGDEGVIDLAFDAVTFTTLLNWLSATKSDWGYDISSFRFEATDAPGKIRANMTLTPQS